MFYVPYYSDELGFKAGEIIIGATQEGEWWSGSRAANPEVVGLFPGNYVEVRGVVPIPRPFVCVS